MGKILTTSGLEKSQKQVLANRSNAVAYRGYMTPGARSKFGAPCSRLRSFGSKCTVLKKELVTLLELFGAPIAPSLPPWWNLISGHSDSGQNTPEASNFPAQVTHHQWCVSFAFLTRKRPPEFFTPGKLSFLPLVKRRPSEFFAPGKLSFLHFHRAQC